MTFRDILKIKKKKEDCQKAEEPTIQKYVLPEDVKTTIEEEGWEDLDDFGSNLGDYFEEFLELEADKYNKMEEVVTREIEKGALSMVIYDDGTDEIDIDIKWEYKGKEIPGVSVRKKEKVLIVSVLHNGKRQVQYQYDTLNDMFKTIRLARKLYID